MSNLELALTMTRDFAAIGLVLSVAGCTPGRPSGRPFTVSTADVHRFATIWQRTGDSSCPAFRTYFDSASAGLHAYARKFDVDVGALCAAVKRRPDRYATLSSNLAAFDSAAERVDSMFIRLRAIDSAPRTASVYFVVGNGIAAGTTTRGSDPMILIGAELTRSTAGLTWTIAHEIAHTQQHYPIWGSLTGGPTFLRGTVLRVAIAEGSADLIAELLTETPKHDAYAEEHEATLWSNFQREMHTRDYARWFYNGRNPARGALPPDLGYWVGYRIAKAYYMRQPDKVRAVHDILTIQDFDAFLAASGYNGAPSALPSTPVATNASDERAHEPRRWYHRMIWHRAWLQLFLLARFGGTITIGGVALSRAADAGAIPIAVRQRDLSAPSIRHAAKMRLSSGSIRQHSSLSNNTRWHAHPHAES